MKGREERGEKSSGPQLWGGSRGSQFTNWEMVGRVYSQCSPLLPAKCGSSNMTCVSPSLTRGDCDLV